VEGSGNYLIKGTIHETASRIWGKKDKPLSRDTWCPVLDSKSISQTQASFVSLSQFGCFSSFTKKSNANLRP
jgi:hypothetical protein